MNNIIKSMWNGNNTTKDIIEATGLPEYKIRIIAKEMNLGPKTKKKSKIDLSIIPNFNILWLDSKLKMNDLTKQISNILGVSNIHNDTIRSYAYSLGLPDRGTIHSHKSKYLPKILKMEIELLWNDPKISIKHIKTKFNITESEIRSICTKKKSSKNEHISHLFNKKQFIKMWGDKDIKLEEIQKEFSGEFSPASQRTILAFAERLNLPKRPNNPINQRLLTDTKIKDNIIFIMASWRSSDIFLEEILENVGVSKRSLYNVFARLDWGEKLPLLNKTTNSGTSFPEKEIQRLIIDNGIIPLMNQKVLKGLEIDIFIPSKDFGIEYNGIMYHCIGKTVFNYRPNTKINREYHLRKTEIADHKGIQLYHIFENEWNNSVKKEIWVSVIKDKLNKNNKLGARKTQVELVSSSDAREFEEINHLQGKGQARVNLGLYYNNELVSLMTFSKGRNSISAKADYELIRFCSKKGLTVQGGASKLFKYFVRNYNPKNITSFANRRWSNGNLYYKLGFELSHLSPPNYFYFLPKDRVFYSRNKFQKHKLKHFKNYSDSKTEWEIMEEAGYRKIYDSGNYVFKWSL